MALTREELMARYGNIGAVNTYTVPREIGADGVQNPYTLARFANAPTTGMGDFFTGEVGYNPTPEQLNQFDVPIAAGDGGYWRGQYNPAGEAQDIYFQKDGLLDKYPWLGAAGVLGLGAAAGALGGGAAAVGGSGLAGEAAALGVGNLYGGAAGAAAGAGAGAAGAGAGLTLAEEAATLGIGGGGAAGSGSLFPGVANSTLVKGGIGAVSALAGATAGDPIKGTTSSDMAERLQPYSNDVLGRAQTAADRPFTPYDGANPYAQTVDQRDAIAGQREGMQRLPAALSGGQGYMTDTFAGKSNFTPGQVSQASNPYLGQTTGHTAGVGSVADKISGVADANNPYIGGQADRASTSTANQAGRNALLGMNNPYLQNQVNSAMGDVSRQYNLTTAPQRQAQAVGSGSFGNTGVAQMQGEDQRQLASELGRVSSNMRMQDYGMQAQLGEGQAGREQQTNITNAGLLNAGSQFNAGQSAGDWNRNTAAFQAQQNPRLQAMLSGYTTDAGNQMGTQQFNAGLLQADLGRNSAQAQNLSQFNSGVSNQNIGNAQNAWAGNNNLAAGMLGQNLGYNTAMFPQQQQLYNMGTGNATQNAAAGTFDYNEWLRGQGYNDAQIQQYSNIVGQQAGPGRVTTTEQPGANPWATGLGTAAGLAGLAKTFKWI